MKNRSKKSVLKDGNTSIQSTQKKYWSFTFNDYSEEAISVLERRFREICKKYVFQKEKGGLNERPHLQGAIELIKPMRWTEFNLYKEIHWEKTRNVEASWEYCQKDETRDGEVYKYGFPREVVTLKLAELYPWEKTILDIIKTEPNNRTIHYIVDKVGGTGKSQFTKFLCIKYNATFTNGGRHGDVVNLVYNTCMDKCTTVIFDIPRDRTRIAYSSIECIKNGMVSNTKFETGVKYFNSPHVFVFSNFEPETSKLSMDRWKVYTISESRELVEQKIDDD